MHCGQPVKCQNGPGQLITLERASKTQAADCLSETREAGDSKKTCLKSLHRNYQLNLLILQKHIPKLRE